jgi:hypothetical protein
MAFKGESFLEYGVRHNPASSCPEFCAVPQYWAHCRWANPSDLVDFNTVAAKLATIQEMHIQLRQCTLERVLNVISLLRIPRQPTKESDSESDSDSPEPSSFPGDQQQLPSLAGLGWLHSTPAVHPGQSLHLPPLSMDAVSFRIYTQRCQRLPSLWFLRPSR